MESDYKQSVDKTPNYFYEGAYCTIASLFHKAVCFQSQRLQLSGSGVGKQLVQQKRQIPVEYIIAHKRGTEKKRIRSFVSY